MVFELLRSILDCFPALLGGVVSGSVGFRRSSQHLHVEANLPGTVLVGGPRALQRLHLKAFPCISQALLSAQA